MSFTCASERVVYICRLCTELESNLVLVQNKLVNVKGRGIPERSEAQ